MPLSFFALLFCVAALGIVTITTLVYVFSARRPEARFALVTSLLLIAGLFALSPLVFIARDPELRGAFERKARGQAFAQETRRATPRQVVQEWIRLYGTDTARAAELTTPQFRKGKTVQEWVADIQLALSAIGYEHLGGEITNERVIGDIAIVTVHAHVAAVDGISLQEECYLLKHVHGRWLIDGLDIEKEVVPGGKRRHAI